MKTLQPTLSDLFSPVPPAWEDELLSTYLLPPTDHVDVRPQLRDSIAEIGVQQPILVGQSGSQLYVIDGLHRLAAARAADVREIPARVSSTVDSIGSSALTLISNGQRRANEIAEYDAIVNMAEAGHDEKMIAKLTGIGVGTVRKRLGISELIPELMARFRAGEMSAPAAEAAAKLTGERQLALYEATRELPKIRYRDVMDAKMLQQAEAAAELPDDMFGGDDDEDDTPGGGSAARAAAQEIERTIARMQEDTTATLADVAADLAEIRRLAGLIAQSA